MMLAVGKPFKGKWEALWFEKGLGAGDSLLFFGFWFEEVDTFPFRSSQWTLGYLIRSDQV